ncbi:hypothetical protein BGW80DRAFT_1444351 [Lactifluus volemus]|nr:hypothetical protein BGW80DRAFT_1444351 [Lactifluus volemus]
MSPTLSPPPQWHTQMVNPVSDILLWPRGFNVYIFDTPSLRAKRNRSKAFLIDFADNRKGGYATDCGELLGNIADGREHCRAVLRMRRRSTRSSMASTPTFASRARYRFGVKWDEPQELDNKFLGWNKKERLTRRFAEGFVAGITVIKSTGLRPTA